MTIETARGILSDFAGLPEPPGESDFDPEIRQHVKPVLEYLHDLRQALSEYLVEIIEETNKRHDLELNQQ